MQYALLIYGRPDAPDLPGSGERPIDAAITAVLARPCVTGWARLHADESATTVRADQDTMLLTDGPYIESKEYLAGMILIEADDLDGALAVAHELQEARTGGGGGIEVRPLREVRFRGA